MVNWAYIAGFFDGEGNVGVRSHRISIYQNDTAPLLAIQRFLEKHKIISTLYKRPSRNTNFASEDRCHVLRFCGQPDVRRFLGGVRPYLIVKKQSSEDLLRFLILYPPFNPKTVGKLGRERSPSKFGRGLHARIKRDSSTGRFASLKST